MTENYSIEKLTRPWNDVLSPRETGLGRYIAVDYPALIDMLNDACRGNDGGSNGQRSKSTPASRTLLDLEAHGLREHIDGTVRTWVTELSRQRPEADLKAALVQLDGILHAHHAAGTITDREYERIIGFFPRWCEKIWKLYDPPTVKELIGPCPNPDCEATRFNDGQDGEGAALIAFYSKGTGGVRAKCRVCSWEWSDPAQLVILGRHLGATQDDEFLRAAGL